MCVCPSVCMVQLRSLWTDFLEIRYLSIFLKCVQKIGETQTQMGG